MRKATRTNFPVVTATGIDDGETKIRILARRCISLARAWGLGAEMATGASAAAITTKSRRVPGGLARRHERLRRIAVNVYGRLSLRPINVYRMKEREKDRSEREREKEMVCETEKVHSSGYLPFSVGTRVAGE